MWCAAGFAGVHVCKREGAGMLQSAMPDPEEEARQRMRALGAKKVVQQLGGLRLEAG